MSATIASALAKAQSEFPEIHRTKTVTVRTKTGGSYTYSYATHPDMDRLVKPTLNANGLAISQVLSNLEGKPALRTILMHESGEFLEDVFPLPLHGGETAQEIGSAITYVRRYALAAVLGIATEDDDDGAAASSAGDPYGGHRAGAPAPVAAEGESPATPAAASPADNPAEKARLAAEAAKAARTPQDDGKPENVVISFGKHKGQTLGSVPSAYLEWLVGNFQAKNQEQTRILTAAQEMLGMNPFSLPDDDIPF